MSPATAGPAGGPAARRRPDPAFVGHDPRRSGRPAGADSVDLRGHGDSEWAADGDYTLDALRRATCSPSRHVDAPPALVGASLGGISPLAAIGEHPDEDVARALVLVDVAPRIEEAGRDRIGAFMAEHIRRLRSLDEVADAIQRYNPHRPRPTDLVGLTKNLRKRRTAAGTGTGTRRSSPASSAAGRDALVAGRPERLQAAARGLTVPTLLVRGGSATC